MLLVILANFFFFLIMVLHIPIIFIFALLLLGRALNKGVHLVVHEDSLQFL